MAQIEHAVDHRPGPAADAEPTPMESGQFRGLLRHQAASVALVTAPGDPPVGFTATSFTSVSLHPPLASFCVGRASSSWRAFTGMPYLGVHLLGAEQERLARTFATTGIDRFAGVAWQPGPYGVPVLDGVLAWLVCRVVQRIVAGDHEIVLAEPVRGAQRADKAGAPLVYHQGGYGTVRPS